MSDVLQSRMDGLCAQVLIRLPATTSVTTDQIAAAINAQCAPESFDMIPAPRLQVLVNIVVAQLQQQP